MRSLILFLNAKVTVTDEWRYLFFTFLPILPRLLTRARSLTHHSFINLDGLTDVQTGEVDHFMCDVVI